MEDFEKTTIDSYDQTVDEYMKNVEDLHPTKESEKFRTYLNREASILDLGCGPGRDSKIFADKGFKVVGVDLSKKMIEFATYRVKNAEFHVMDIRKLAFNDNYFDGVWANACFLHIPKKDILTGLKEVYRVLKDNGICYISVKQGDGEILKPDHRYNGIQKFWSFFQEYEIVGELKKAGFHNIESYIAKQEISYATNPWIQIFCRK